MSIKIFIEYKIHPEKERTFLSLLEPLHQYYQEQGIDDFLIYEGVDQPHLIVEEYTVPRYGDYLRMKEERKEEKHPLWAKIHACVQGGAQKIHIWAFKSI